MVANEKDIEEFNDMFDLSSDKSDDEHECSTETTETFDSLAVTLNTLSV